MITTLTRGKEGAISEEYSDFDRRHFGEKPSREVAVRSVRGFAEKFETKLNQPGILVNFGR